MDGFVVVTTPQSLAAMDAKRSINMIKKLNVNVLGVVENMSHFVADDMDPPRSYDIFGRGGAQMMAQRLGLPFLGEVPITPALRANSDRGDPSANFDSGGALAAALEGLVSNLESQVALASLRQGTARPTLTIR